MFDAHRFLLFLVAALLLAITPGPGIFYVLARSLAGGRPEGMLSSFGTFVGGLFHVLAAALGVSAILAASAAAFHTVKEQCAFPPWPARRFRPRHDHSRCLRRSSRHAINPVQETCS